MKHTIIAGMLLILILLVVVMNATFVRSVTDELYTRLNELPVSKGGFEASGGDDVKSFYALWSEKRPSLSLSIHEDELDRMARFFDTLTAGRTAYGLKMTGDYPAQFHIFMRIRED